MDHVAAFRRHADECRAMARSMSDPNVKATWSSLADRWQRCAEVAERAMANATAAAATARTRKMRQWSAHDARQ
jgi:hypothetical protein